MIPNLRRRGRRFDCGVAAAALFLSIALPSAAAVSYLVAAGPQNETGDEKAAGQAAGEKKGTDAMSSNRRVAVTGANRGLGLEFTRQYLKRGDRVFALVRKPEEASDLVAL